MKRKGFHLEGGFIRAVTFAGLLVTGWLLPGTVQAQREDEARAIADTLTVIAAERNYARLNCGHFGRLTRLCQTSDGCEGIGVPGYSLDDPSFISGRLGRPGPYLESGYIRVFTPSWVPPYLPFSCDELSTVDFCYDSAPYPAGMGLPAFSGTGSGEIYVNPTGSPIPCPVPRGTAKLSFPAIVSPPPGSTLAGPKIAIRWTENAVPVSEWRLRVGLLGEYYDFFLGTNLSTEVAGLPLDGRTIPFRLWYRIADVWEYSDFEYKAATVTAKPTITDPPPGSTLTGPSALFQWTSNGLPVSNWWLYVGSKPGAAEYFRAAIPGNRTIASVTNLPTDGRALYVRLWYYAGGAWKFSDFQYTAAKKAVGPVTSLR